MVPYNKMTSHHLPPFIKLKNSDGTEDIHYSIFYDGIPKEFRNISQMELNETDEKRKKGIQKLREVLKREEISGIDDTILLAFLRKCKYNVNKAESQIFQFVKSRQFFLEKLKEADMTRLEHVLDHMVVGLLPFRDKKGRVIFFSAPNFNFELFDLDDAMLVYFLNLAFIVSLPMTSITGVVYIGEAKTPALDILYPIMKTFRQNLGHLTSFPHRIAKLEILNEVFIVRWTVNLIRPFLSAKHVERINFHGSDVKSMRKTYHPDLLPEEFGGTMGPLSNTFYKEKMLNFIKKLRSETI